MGTMALITKNMTIGFGDLYNRDYVAEQALTDAQTMEASGNSFFREGKYKTAVEVYLRAVAVVNTTLPNADTNLSLMVALRSNSAACYIEMEQYVIAVDWARTAVAIDPLHLKSYRKLCKVQHSLNMLYATIETLLMVVALTLPIFNDLWPTRSHCHQRQVASNLIMNTCYQGILVNMHESHLTLS